MYQLSVYLNLKNEKQNNVKILSKIYNENLCE